MSVFGYIVSICVPDKATLNAVAHALQCTTAGPYNAIPTSLLGVGSVCGLGPDLIGIRSVSLAARYRTAACSNTLNQGLEKIQAAQAFDFAHACAQLQLEKRNFLLPPWLVAPRKRSILYVAWIIMVNLMRLPQDKKQKVATTLLRDELYRQDFAGPIS